MTVVVSMLRGVNVGGHHKVKMDALRALYESLGLRDAETYIQSGNVVFRTEERDLTRLAQRLEKAFEQEFGFRSEVVLLTAAQLRDAIGANPLARRRNLDPRKLLVTFLARDPKPEARDKVLQMKTAPEEVCIEGRAAYIYYTNGMARTKLSWIQIANALGTPGTGRNWNTTQKLLEIAENLEKKAPKRT